MCFRGWRKRVPAPEYPGDDPVAGLQDDLPKRYSVSVEAEFHSSRINRSGVKKSRCSRGSRENSPAG